MSKASVPTPTRATFRQNSGPGAAAGGAGATTPTAARSTMSPKVAPISGRMQFYGQQSASGSSEQRRHGAASEHTARSGAAIEVSDGDDTGDDEPQLVSVVRRPLKKYGRVANASHENTSAAAPTAQAPAAQQPPPAFPPPAYVPPYLQERKASVRKARYAEEAREMEMAELDQHQDGALSSDPTASSPSDTASLSGPTAGSRAAEGYSRDDDGMDVDDDDDETEDDEDERPLRVRRTAPARTATVNDSDSSDLTDLELEPARSNAHTANKLDPQVRKPQGQLKKQRREAAAAFNSRRAQDGQQQEASVKAKDHALDTPVQRPRPQQLSAQSLTAALIGDVSKQQRRQGKRAQPTLLDQQDAFESSSEPTFTDFFADSTDDDDADEVATTITTTTGGELDARDAAGVGEEQRIELDDAAIQAFLADALLPAGSSDDEGAYAEDDDEEEDPDAAFHFDEEEMMSMAVLNGTASMLPPSAAHTASAASVSAPTNTPALDAGAFDSVPILVIEETDGRLIRARATGGDAVFGSDGEFEYVGGDGYEDDDDFGFSSDASSSSMDSDGAGAHADTSRNGAGRLLHDAEDEEMDSDEDAYMDGAGNPLFMDADEAAKAGLLDDSDDEADEDMQHGHGRAGKRAAQRQRERQNARNIGRHRMPGPSHAGSSSGVAPSVVSDSSGAGSDDDGETTDDLGEYDMPFPRLLVGSVAPRGGRAARRARKLAKDSRARSRKALKAARQLAIVNHVNGNADASAGATANGLMLPPMFGLGGLPASFLQQDFAAGGPQWTAARLSPAATAPPSLITTSASGTPTPTLQLDLPFAQPMSASTSATGLTSPSAASEQQKPASVTETPAPAPAGPRMGTFATSAKSRRRALIDGSAGVPSPFALSASAARSSRSARRGGSGASTPARQRSLSKADSRHARQEMLSPLAARRAKAIKSKKKKPSQDLRRQAYRIKEIDLHDLMHQDAWREMEQRQLQQQQSSSPRSRSRVLPQKTPRSFVGEYGFNRDAPATMPLTSAQPYKKHSVAAAAAAAASPSSRASSRSRRRSASSNARKRSELSPALPLLHISDPSEHRVQQHEHASRAASLVATSGANSAAGTTPVMRPATASSAAAAPQHAPAGTASPLALGPPSSECGNGLMQFSPLFGGIVPALNMRSDDLDSFTL